MRDMKIAIGPLAKGDEKEVLKLLSEAKLPTHDLTPAKLRNFLVARLEDGKPIGAIGIELDQEVGLLRSLVVDPLYRGRGIGKALTHELESFAHRKGVKTLFLLTTTASDFFPKFGYQMIGRDRVPAAIANTEEFKNICPVSAVCLCKDLNSL